MPAAKSKVLSALSAFETTIQKNEQSGESSGMYLSNRKGGLGASRHSKASWNSSKDNQTESSSVMREPVSKAKSPVQSEAKKAAARLRKRTANMNRSQTQKSPRGGGRGVGRKGNTEDGDDQVDFFKDGKVPATLKLASLTPAHADSSCFTADTAELTVEDIAKDRPEANWNSFEDSSNFFSEAEESSYAGGGSDDESLLSEFSFNDDNWDPETKQKKSKKPNSTKAGPPAWAASFAVTYQHRPDESDSEFDCEEKRDKIRTKQMQKPGPSRPGLSKTPSNRSLQRSNSSRVLQRSGSSRVLQRSGSSRSLQRSSSNRSLNIKGEDDMQDMNNSFRSLNSTNLRMAAVGPGGGERGNLGGNFRSMVMGKNDSALGGSVVASDSEGPSDAEGSRRKVVRKVKTAHSQRSNGGDVNASDADSTPSRQSNSKARRPAPKQRMKFTPEEEADIAKLPPAFQSSARRRLEQKKLGTQPQPKRFQVKKKAGAKGGTDASLSSSSHHRSPTRKAKPPPKESASADSGDEMDELLNFKTDHASLSSSSHHRSPTRKAKPPPKESAFADSGDEMDELLAFKTDRSFFDFDNKLTAV
jgi:hypothetical protein